MISKFIFQEIKKTLEMPNSVKDSHHSKNGKFNENKGQRDNGLKVPTGKESMKCEFCDYDSSVKSNMKKHVALVHEKKRFIKCKICDYASFSPSKTKRHIAAVHDNEFRQKNEFKFKCFICKNEFITYHYLKLHMKAIHKEENALLEKEREDQVYGRKKRNLRCRICFYVTFKSQHFLLKHMKESHENDNCFKKSLQCSICKTKFIRKSSFDDHMQKLHKD